MRDTMIEEKHITEKFGNENPFRVPDNYFDEFPQRVMKRIVQQKKRRKIIHWSIAAMMTGCILGSTFVFTNFRQQDIPLEADNSQYIEDALDYSMINNMEIATYLTEAE
ncbi:MAG: hypothetical protein J6W52_04200 [Bacteroidaceae bacterium]|nr:hypothetical protein [Bacteroidaceae bacterium]